VDSFAIGNTPILLNGTPAPAWLSGLHKYDYVIGAISHQRDSSNAFSTHREWTAAPVDQIQIGKIEKGEGRRRST
jgi:hypothetical protein